MTDRIKKIIFPAICTGLAAILIISITVSSPHSANSTESTTAVTVYTVKDYEGKIGIFKSGESSPVTVYDFNVSSYPEADRELLKNGIYAENEQALQKIIEDYTS